MGIDHFNETIKIGNTIRYKDDAGTIQTDVVKAEASEIGGTPVMWLKGAGSYMLSRFVEKVMQYELKDGKILKDGHTMFDEDIVKDLKRKSFLEQERNISKKGDE